jgi:hypothetical protein
MAIDPSFLVVPVIEWVQDKIRARLNPLRVDYNEKVLKIELLPWAQMPALLGALLVVIALVLVFEGSWTALFVVVFFGGGATALTSWALRKIRTIILGNKPQQWIRVTEHGIFWTESKVTKVTNLKAITYEQVNGPGVFEDPGGLKLQTTYTVSVMTGEGSTNLIEKQSESDASEIVSYLNGFFFDDEAEGDVQETP